MKLWLISQDEREGWDIYDSAVVAADTEDQAKNTMPDEYTKFSDKSYHGWCSGLDKVKVKLIGEAQQGIEAGVILASFNAG